MAEFNQNLWAPWRMEYIRSLDEESSSDGCFLCRYWAHPDADRENRVVLRGETAFAVLNRFPYTNGHLLIAHAGHKGEPADLTADEWCELSDMIRQSVEMLRRAVSPQGFNIGYNLGRCAGAGLPDHLHAHVVPRWSGDTNFMAVAGDARVVPQALDALWQQLVQLVDSAGLK